MRFFNIGGRTLALSQRQGNMTLKQFHETSGVGYLSKIRTKQYKDACCDVRAIVREGKNDSSTIFVDKDSKKPMMFKINIKNTGAIYDELNITGSYNQGKPSAVSVKGTVRNLEKELSNSAREVMFQKLAKNIENYSNMTKKLLKKTFEHYND